MNYLPDVRVTANSQDVTDVIMSRLKSLRITDEAGTTSDTLEISLADHDPEAPIEVPETGAEIEVAIGYADGMKEMGLFICDEVELSGWPGAMVIRARAAPYDKSQGGKSNLQTQKTRSWRAGTTVGSLVKKVAEEHGMKSSVSDGLAGIKLPHTDQSSESDMNLLHRLAKRYDAIAKPAGGLLLFVKRGEAKTGSGQDMPVVDVAPGETTSYRVTLAKRNAAGTVVAYYRDNSMAKRKEVTVGDGEPVYRIRMGYKDQESALEAAKAEQRKRARGQEALDVTLPGNPDITAEAVLNLAGFRDRVDGRWLVTRVEHYIGPDAGYRCNVECEKPNSAEGVSDSTGAVKDQDQGGVEEG